jgi:hypothetical protein
MREESLDMTGVPQNLTDGLTTTASAVDISDTDPSTSQKPFLFEEFFLGRTRGHGLFHDRFGRLRQEFTVDMNGWWSDDLFVLDEDFRFIDGRKQVRQWHVTKRTAGHYSAFADDIIRTATGICTERMIHWRYKMRVPVGKQTITMRFDDRMYLQHGEVVLNVSKARKFGLLIGQLTAAYERLS